jgi:hypothetical protein
MGGRGTYAIGNNVPYTYKTVDKIDGIKVLKGLEGKHGLPEEAHSSSSYISLYNDGSVKQIRVYNKDHTSFVDIEYSTHQGHKKLHAHDYISGERQRARDLSDKELKKYSKYFGGKK